MAGNLQRLTIKSSASGELVPLLDSGESFHLLDSGELADGTCGEVVGEDVEPRGDAVGQAVLTLHAADYSTVVAVFRIRDILVRIRMRIRLRILHFSSMAFKMPTQK